jgi:uroporphyrinogen III methyltransferase/synthase
VQNFAAMLPEAGREKLMQNVTVACIGPITAGTAENLGFKVSVCSEEYTITGLVDAITAYYTGKAAG